MGDEKIPGLLWCRRPVLYIWGYIPWSWQNAASSCHTVPRCDFLALGTHSKSLNQESSLYPDHCLSSELLDYFLSFSSFHPPDGPRIAPLSTCVCYCVLLRKSVQWARSSELTLALVPILHQLYLLAPWLFSLNKEANFAGAQGLYWNGGTMSWMRESFWYWRWSQGASRCSNLSWNSSLIRLKLRLDLNSQTVMLWTVHSCSSDGKESACNTGEVGLIPRLGRFPGEGNGNTFQYSCLENPADRGAWQAMGREESDRTEWRTLCPGQSHHPALGLREVSRTWELRPSPTTSSILQSASPWISAPRPHPRPPGDGDWEPLTAGPLLCLRIPGLGKKTELEEEEKNWKKCLTQPPERSHHSSDAKGSFPKGFVPLRSRRKELL